MAPRHHCDKIVCECLKVTEGQILEAIRTKKIGSIADIIEYTCAGDGCNACHPLLKDYLDRNRRERSATSTPLLVPAARPDSFEFRPL